MSHGDEDTRRAGGRLGLPGWVVAGLFVCHATGCYRANRAEGDLTDADAEADADADTDSDSDVDGDTDSDADADTDTDTNTDSVSETDCEPDELGSPAIQFGACDESGWTEMACGAEVELFEEPAGCCHFFACIRERGLTIGPSNEDAVELHYEIRDAGGERVDDYGGVLVRPYPSESKDGWQAAEDDW